MVKELSPNLFCIQVPLPGSPLKYLNSYVVRAKDRSLIIDTGFNNDACFEAMISGLDKLGVDLASADIFVTHFHADHFSLVPRLKTPSTGVFFNRPEAELMENWQGFDTMIENAGRHGFPASSLQKALDAHPGNKFGAEWAPEIKLLSQGQVLRYGEYALQCIETPGHTLGHLCLYDAAHKVFISGDHVLIDITPNIQCWTDQDNPLKQYMDSLNKVRNMEVEIVLPGHRRQFQDLAARVDELLAHHHHRLDEIRNILDQGPKTAWETAGQMTWDIRAASWDEFPIAQQWFATGEALSHLRYLEEENEIYRETGEKTVVFNYSSREI